MPGFDSMLNIHPLFVHFPIALTYIAGLFALAHLATQRVDYLQMASILIYLSAVSAVVTLLTGMGAADSLGHDSPGHDYVHAHRNMMQVYTGMILALAVLQGLADANRWPIFSASWLKGIRLVLLASSLVVLTIGSDLGGQLVFEHGMGVKQPETIIDPDGKNEVAPTDTTTAKADDGHDHKH